MCVCVCVYYMTIKDKICSKVKLTEQIYFMSGLNESRLELVVLGRSRGSNANGVASTFVRCNIGFFISNIFTCRTVDSYE